MKMGERDLADVVAERLYLDDEGVIRKREAVVAASERNRMGSKRHEAYVALLNRHAHQPVGRNGGGIRVWKDREAPEHVVRRILEGLGPAQREPREVLAPETMFVHVKHRAKPGTAERKKVRKTMELVDGQICWRRMDETQAGYLHPALEGLAAGWNKRFAGQPVALQHPGRSAHDYIKVGARFLRLDEVMAMLDGTSDAAAVTVSAVPAQPKAPPTEGRQGQSKMELAVALRDRKLAAGYAPNPQGVWLNSEGETWTD